MRYEILNDGVVVNTIEASLEFVTAAYPGAFRIVVEPAPPAQPGSTIITPLSFRNRFTQAEKVTIEIACLDVPTAAMSARQQAAALRVSQADTAAASYIDLSRADTRAGVQALQTAGIIGAGRAAVILDTPVADVEKPKG